MGYIIQLKNITKGFPGIIANDHISIDIEDGEIHALAGENGAGKSTLMNILYGLYQPDEGEIIINGQPVRFNSSKDSIEQKIGMVHQHFMLIPKLTVAENIIVGQEIGNKFKIDREKAEEKITKLSEQFGLKVDPRKKVGQMSVTEQQRVEILKVLYREAQILIFDEPTAVLTPQEIDEFCEIMLNLKKMGKTIIFISHKLAEVMKISDHITVIRKGKVIGTVEKSSTNPDELTRMMVGRDVDLGRKERPHFAHYENLLELKDIHYVNREKIDKLKHINLSLRSGEVLGIAGVDGNGQEELVQVICGQLPVDSGSLLLKGKDITQSKTRERKDQGIGLIPEDRHRDGLVLDFSIAENLILGLHYHGQFAKNGLWIDDKTVKENAKKLREDFDIRCANTEVNAGTLSGGNQQKIVIAREATRNPDVFVAVQPTRGLDIGAIEFVQETLLKQRNNGKGVILFSLELDEILSVSDRIAIMYKGEIIDVVDAEKITRQELGLMMLGSRKKTKDGEKNVAG
ncbi:ABC transporter ATP-binding protein [Irregularibacter muris]|uniref:ABC transporter ATP-binding protein n=1 Tax=Irregularibacter muris TaxID=1796619 RepID=A0AAE3HHK4_9FIRM|nr:ABC transporter ATP-binding protein [Irregularibacter muris]MCR1899559.1 ABC transporter ATP-binding protein [Irregularibacter muris]